MTSTVRFVGSGDSFGSGGRFQTCILVDAGGSRFTLDFGASSLIALRQQQIDPNSIDAILPVPLHSKRMLERGFNQSTEIAEQLSSRLHIPVDTLSLVRTRATESQSGLSLNKRRRNLIKAFHFDPCTPYQSVAIVDDVITSGSTMAEICKQIRRSGITEIQVWSLARALKQD